MPVVADVLQPGFWSTTVPGSDERVGRSVPDLATRAGWVRRSTDDPPVVEVPRNADTGYLTHALFRYVGKLPPPLVADLIGRYTERGQTVVDPMCGGGTTAIEAVSSGRESINFDINPVARLVTGVVSREQDLSGMDAFLGDLRQAPPMDPPSELQPYYSAETYGKLRRGLDLAPSDLERVLCLAVARKASFANTKKINTVVDRTKRPEDIDRLLVSAAARFRVAFRDLADQSPAKAVVRAGDASSLGLPSSSAEFVFLHPPYLTNTAFSEVTHLQLLLMDKSPTKIRASELAYRGSYFHVQNGLKKYLVGWYRILEEAKRVLVRGGHAALVIGDGRIERVRIPVATITAEYARDLSLTLVDRAVHRLNNQTGLTLSRRMLSQHVLVVRK